MFFCRLITQQIRITRDVRLLGLSFYKTVSFPKVPVILNHGIHTSQQDNDRSFVYKKYVPPKKLPHDYKNMALKRPMSPWTEYSMNLASGTSILQRITGTIISFYTLAIAGGALFLPRGIDTYVTTIESLHIDITIAQILKFILLYPFFFHYFLGLRFVGFNFVLFLNPASAYQTAYAAIAASLATSAFCAFFAG